MGGKWTERREAKRTRKGEQYEEQASDVRLPGEKVEVGVGQILDVM